MATNEGADLASIRLYRALTWCEAECGESLSPGLPSASVQGVSPAGDILLGFYTPDLPSITCTFRTTSELECSVAWNQILRGDLF